VESKMCLTLMLYGEKRQILNFSFHNLGWEGYFGACAGGVFCK